MADNESLPGISIPIVADYSALQSQFAEAQSAAQQAGTNIAGAFTGAAAGVTTFEQAVEQAVASGKTLSEAIAGASTYLSQAGSAAQQSAGEVSALSNTMDPLSAGAKSAAESTAGLAASEVAAGQAATESAHETASLREQFLALGEALAVTAALKEFGERALDVAAEQQNLIISLTALTGSAEAAQVQLEEINKFAFSNALGIDAVETATQKLIAFGFNAEQAGKLLQAAADSAAATGNSFDAVATKISNIALSGNAGARQLVALGISADDLAKKMGVASDEVTKAFKALDQSQRVEVLTAALDKFGGVAGSVAQGMSGQWQNLENDLHNVFEQIGGELLPVVTSLIGLLRDDVIPFVKGASEAFAELPAPVKEFAIGAGLVVAALAPLAVGLAGLSLAMTGLQTIVPIVTGLMESFGLASVTTAAEEEIAAAATTKLGGAASTAAVELEGAEVAAAGFGGALSLTLAVGVAAAAISLIDLKARLDGAHAALDGISQSNWNDWLKRATDGLKTASISTADLEAAAAKLKTGLELGAISATQYAAAMDAITAAEKRVEAENLADSVAKWTSGLTVLKDTSTKAADGLSLLKQAMDDAAAAQARVAVEYQAGAKTAGDLISANNALAAAQKSYNDALAATKPNEYLDGLKRLASQEEINAASEDVLASKMTLLQRAALLAGQQLFDLNEQAKLLNLQVDAGTAKESDYIAKLGEVASAATNYKTAAEALNAEKLKGEQATANLTDAERNFGIEMLVANKTVDDQGNAIKETTRAVGDFGVELITTTIPTEQNMAGVIDFTNTAINRQIEAFRAADTEVGSLSADIKSLTEDFLGLGDAQSNSASMKLKAPAGYVIQSHYVGESLVIDYAPTPATQLKLSEDAARQQADQQSNPRGATDPVSLAKQTLAEAQAILPLIQQAFQAGNAGIKASDVQSAQQAVASAQSALDKLTGAATTAVQSSGGGSATRTVSTTVVSGPTDTAASGGSYPGVVIHQAPGEVLLVSQTAGNYYQAVSSASGGGDTAGLAAATAADAASVTAMAVSQASDTIKLVVGDLRSLTDVIGAISNSIGVNVNASKNVTGPVSSIGGSSAAAAAAAGVNVPGSRNVTGALTNVTGDQKPYVQPATSGPDLQSVVGGSYIAYPGGVSGYGNYQPPTAPIGPTGQQNGGVQTFHVDFSGANFSGANPDAIKAAIMRVLPDALVRVTRDAGARY
jgi:hypothetical protein